MTMPDEDPVADLDTTTPHSARIWNYWLGGKDNFAVDRKAGDEYAAVFPQIITIARESRAFLGRAVTYLAAEAGIRQFLDVGTGLPIADNTHEVAQRVAPGSRVVYVDNDPLVLAHARALMVPTGHEAGTTEYVHEDMHNPEVLLDKASKVLDLTRPVAVMLMGSLGHVQSLEEARRVVRVLLDAVPSGSYLVAEDGSAAESAETFQEAQDGYDETGATPYVLRTPDEIESLFDGLEWVPPGFTSLPLWRPDPDPDVSRIGTSVEPLDVYGGVARKP
ncbi:SAM-dependent methyltransferase [Pseudonocardia humida]|uniref:SAM-dependent methyltransferase n=1 Tax=Pseudonocardia humida TaxID=2800819 RepID=A0ABT1A3M4_9PSEU|nr:SAM-dependent methyltransferase [Pseudonocardia humida]MCO1657613.1 SAM-dependent methyltransferase [Pseudonocardia humida]